MNAKILIRFLVLVVVFNNLTAQSPTHYPSTGREQPIDLNPVTIFVYFILPVLVLAVFFLVRRWFQKRNREESERRKEKLN